MSDIYELLREQQVALEAIPVYGDQLSVGIPVIGDDPSAQIYLASPLDFSSSADNLSTQVSAQWVALIPLDPTVTLETALDVQESLVTALKFGNCSYTRLTRDPIEFPAAGVTYWLVSVTAQFHVYTSFEA